MQLGVCPAFQQAEHWTDHGFAKIVNLLLWVRLNLCCPVWMPAGEYWLRGRPLNTLIPLLAALNTQDQSRLSPRSEKYKHV
jgi:hypothetical protein